MNSYIVVVDTRVSSDFLNNLCAAQKRADLFCGIQFILISLCK